LFNTLADVIEPEIIVEPDTAGNTAVAPPAAIDAENAGNKPPNNNFGKKVASPQGSFLSKLYR